VSKFDPELVGRFSLLATATVYEAAGRVGAMDHDIKPLAWEMRVCGPAFTVWCPPGDNLMLHRAVAAAQPGDVLVADTGGYLEAGCWGEILTVAACERRLGGFVTNGAIRDAAVIRALGFPVFCRAVSMKATVKKTPGGLGEPVCCGGVYVAPGDLVLGDGDGVVVVPQERLEETLARAAERVRTEESIIDALKQGKTTLELMGLEVALIDSEPQRGGGR
jgi:4-hydroxy-4-methyl-2-oxoglutarate aldolase